LISEKTNDNEKKLVSGKISNDLDFDAIKEEQKQLIEQKPLLFFRKALDLVHSGDIQVKVLLSVLIVAAVMGKVVHVLISGASSSGKSHLLESVLKLIDRDDYLKLIGATEASLRNADQILESVKLLVFTEFDATKPGKDESLDFMLRMLSASDSGGDYLKCQKEGKDWDVVASTIEPISVITTYAKGVQGIGNENLNRMFVIEVEQSQEQVKNIIDILCADDLEKIIKNRKFDFIASLFKGYLYSIKNFCTDIPIKSKNKIIGYSERKVIIPFKKIIRYMFRNVEQTRASRDLERFLEVIKCIALIHKSIDLHSRAQLFSPNYRKNDSGAIAFVIAEPADFDLACQLAWTITNQNLNEITDTDIKIYNALARMQENSNDLCFVGFSPRDISKKTKINYEYCRKRILNLARIGLVKPGISKKNKNRTYTWICSDEPFMFEDYTQYYIDVVNETEEFFKNYKIDKILSDTYSIFLELDEMKVCKALIPPDIDIVEQENLKQNELL